MRLSLKLGTRKSCLAVAQSQWVVSQLMQIHKQSFPELSIELLGLDTQGDKILDRPLQSVPGKDFFVAELDAALLSGKVDFTVHSLKDLSLERPPGIKLTCIPKREDARDILVFAPRVKDKLLKGKLKKGSALRIGTSSPRRLENLPPFLRHALPRRHLDEIPELEFLEIRGNVNTRLKRLLEEEGSERYVDAVALALAGLIRLERDGKRDRKATKELTDLLSQSHFMILPYQECPVAPGQGALALECRSDDSELQELLSVLHHPETAEAVRQERSLLKKFGGGCHQRFGASFVSYPNLGSLLYLRGLDPNGVRLDDFFWKPQESLPTSLAEPVSELLVWDGSYWRPKSEKRQKEIDLKEATGKKACFIAHSRAFLASTSSLHKMRIWTSGWASWKILAREGLWVEGCAEGLGFESILELLKQPVLALPDFSDWVVLTHSDALLEWEALGLKAIGTYQLNQSYSQLAKNQLKRANQIYWGSASQFRELSALVSEHAQHACGPGKTLKEIRSRGLSPLVFPSLGEWKKWIRHLKQAKNFKTNKPTE